MMTRTATSGSRTSLLRLFAVIAMTAGATMLASAPLRGDFAPARLSDVHGVDDLKRWFNMERGPARVILLLSPT